MRRRSSMLVVALMLLAVSPAAAAAAARMDALHDRPVIGTCIRSTAGSRSWLEMTLWGLYDQERGWPGAEIANDNGTFDLGPLQVNSSWVPVIAAALKRDERDVHRWLRDDPCFNVGVAAWLFLANYSRRRDYWRAVGAYHSPTGWRARTYAAQVAGRLRGRFGATIFVASKGIQIRR
jgi:hypothetical protein